MPDALLVALVAIAVSAASGLLGAAITGWITLKNTKEQLNAQHAQFLGQLHHNSEEARKERLVEARKVYLLRLSEAMSDSYSYCLNLRLNAKYIEFLKEEGQPLPTDLLMSAMSNDPRDPVLNFAKEISPLIGRISDPTLQDLASSYQIHLFELRKRIFLAIQTASPLDDDITALVNSEMLAFNQRIEQLLYGELALPQEESPGPSQPASQ